MPQCKGCSKEIVFAKNQDGKTIPLEKARHLYEIGWSPELNSYVAAKMERDVYQSHFLNCPKANQFSGSR